MPSKLIVGFFLIAITLSLTAAGQSQPATSEQQPTLSTEQVVDRLIHENERRASLLQHYRGCRHYSLDYHGFPSGKSAEMVVAMDYSAPATKHFQIVQQHGSPMLINHVLRKLIDSEQEATDEENRRRTALTPDNYEFQMAGRDIAAGRPQYILEVIPKTKNKFLYKGKIWVDATDFAVARVSAEPAKNPSFWISHTEINHQYEKIGQFWLPATNTSITKVRFGGTAKLKIDYLDYRIGSPETAPTGGDVCSGVTGESPAASN
jgi:hypothetical protein